MWSAITQSRHCQRSNRNSTTCQELQQGGCVYIKSYMAVYWNALHNQEETSATTFWLFPLTRGLHSNPQPDIQRYTQRRVGHLVISFGATKPPAHPEVGDGVSSWNIRKPSHPDAGACLRKFHFILSQQKLQDLYKTQFFTKVTEQFTFNYTTETLCVRK